MTRTELIAALEAAEGPSRELDAEIAIALIGRDKVSLSYVKGEEHEWQPGWPESAVWLPVPHYTESIDATLSFTPEGLTLVLKVGQTFAAAELYETVGMKDYQRGFAEHDEPAIALCIANFRALGEKT